MISLKEQLARRAQPKVETPDKALKTKLLSDVSELLGIRNFSLTSETVYLLAPHFLDASVLGLLFISRGEFISSNDMLLPLMPFHETTLFTKLSVSEQGHFLSALKAPLQRKTLAMRLHRDPVLLEQILGHVLQTAKRNIHYPQLSSFYLATLVELLDLKPDASVIRTILANVFTLSQQSLQTEMKSSVLIVLTHISLSINFTLDIFTNIQILLCTFLTNHACLDMIFLALVSMHQTQTNLVLSSELVEKMCLYEEFAGLVVDGLNKFVSDEFVRSVVLALVKAAFTSSSAQTTLASILSSGMLPRTLLTLIGKSVDSVTRESFDHLFTPVKVVHVMKETKAKKAPSAVEIELARVNELAELIHSTQAHKLTWNEQSDYAVFLQRTFVELHSLPPSSNLLELLFKRHLSTTPLQFFVHFFTQDQPQHILKTALQLTSEIVKTQSNMCFQMLLPYTLPLLSHESVMIREKAKILLEDIHSCYSTLTKTVYAPNTQLELVSPEACKVFLESIPSSECCIDPKRLKSWMNEYFESSKERILLFLLSHLKTTDCGRLFVLLLDIKSPLTTTTLLPTAFERLDAPLTESSAKFIVLFMVMLKQANSKHVNKDSVHSFVRKLLSLDTQPDLQARLLLNFPVTYYKQFMSSKRMTEVFQDLMRLAFTQTSVKQLMTTLSFSPAVYMDALKATGYLKETATPNIKHLIFINELLLTTPMQELTPLYFKALTNLLNKSHPSSEYAKQLILTNLQQTIHAEVPETVLRVDTLVQVLRTSMDPSTQALVLIVLSDIARWNARIVVTNILPIFTFMGTMLRQDDEYTFHVISKTLVILLPNLKDQVDDVIDIFVESVGHIPKHRRIKVFELLVKGTSLPKILSKLVEKKEDIIATQLTLKYSVDAILSAVEVIASEQFASWIDSLLANKLFKCILEKTAVEGTIQKMFKLLKDASNKEPIYGIIAKLNGMLQPDQFVEMCTSLMNHTDTQIKHNALTLFAETSATAPPTSAALFATSISTLTLLIATETLAETRQYALVCLSVLLKNFGKVDLVSYLPLLELGCGLLAETGANDNIVVSCLAMLSLLTMSAGPKALPSLSKTMPRALSLFASSNDLVLLAVMSYFCTLIETLPQFVSPYMKQILECLFDEKIIKMNKSSKPAAQKVHDKTLVAQSQLKKVPVRVLLNALYAFYTPATPLLSLQSFFALLDTLITSLPRESIAEHHQKMSVFFLHALDHPDTSLHPQIDLAYRAYILKLNDPLFKPHFHALLAWATPQRTPQFYRTIHTLFLTLKSLFSPYYPYILDKSIAALDSPELLPTVLDSLHLWIQHRTDLDLTPSLTRLLPHLITLVTNTTSATLDLYTTHLLPPLLLLCTASTPLHSPLLTHIHTLSQHPSPEPRLLSLTLLKQIYQSIGEEFVVLLPETIPFLAELMEDGDARVEKLCQEVCAVIQNVLGEDIQQYFNA